MSFSSDFRPNGSVFRISEINDENSPFFIFSDYAQNRISNIRSQQAALFHPADENLMFLMDYIHPRPLDSTLSEVELQLKILELFLRAWDRRKRPIPMIMAIDLVSEPIVLLLASGTDLPSILRDLELGVCLPLNIEIDQLRRHLRMLELDQELSNLYRTSPSVDSLSNLAASFPPLGIHHLYTPDEKGQTPLHRAVIEKSRPIIQFLFQHNVSASIPDSNGSLPLHLAVDNFLKDRDIIRMLVRYNYSALDAVDNDGNTPIHLSTRVNENFAYSAFKLLIQLGSQSFDRPNNKGALPIMSAIERLESKVVKLLRVCGTVDDESMMRMIHSSFMFKIMEKKTLALGAPISNDERLAIRFEIYFAPSLLDRLLFWC